MSAQRQDWISTTDDWVSTTETTKTTEENLFTTESAVISQQNDSYVVSVVSAFKIAVNESHWPDEGIERGPGMPERKTSTPWCVSTLD